MSRSLVNTTGACEAMAVYPPIPIIIVSCIAIPLIAFVLGVLLYYEIRKLFARMQSRRGPLLLVPGPLRPLLGTSRIFQPLWDILKLLNKETTIPETANKTIFKAAPYLALVCLIITTLLIPIAGHSPFDQFEFSLVLILYLLIAVTLALVLGASGSSSPWASIGSRREVELMLAYEVPLIISIFSVALMTGLPESGLEGVIPTLPGSLSLAELVRFQNVHYIQILGFKIPALFLLLNPFAAIAALLAIAGKLHIKPFDIPEAEVELVAGPLTEYSGKLLGVWEIVKMFLIFVSTTLYIDLFLGGGIVTLLPPGLPSIIASVIVFLIEAGIVVFVYTVLHTANPRYKIEQVFRWFLKYPLVLAILGLIWAYIIAMINIPGITFV